MDQDKQARIEKLEASIARLRKLVDPEGRLEPHFPDLACPHFQTCYALSVINELESIIDDLRKE